MWLTSFLQIPFDMNPMIGYPLRFVELLIGGAILAFGIACEVRCDSLMLAGEGFPLAISKTVNRDFGKVKIYTDTFLVCVGTVLMFIYFGRWSWEMVGVGTLVSMFYVGLMVRVFSPHIGWLDKIFIPKAERAAAVALTGDEWNGNRIITIARMYGSGGNAVGEEVYNRYVAELKVVRSYYYYTLFDCFGRIPYMEDYASDNVPQSETWEVWNKLVTTLEENAPLLPQADVPNKAVNYGRATQGMAYALLARLYLNAESFGVTPANCGIEGITSTADFYNKCVEACDKIIDSGVYWIEDDFFTNFKVQNEGSNENIFVIVENGNPNFNFREVAGSFMNKLRITLLTLNYAHQQAWGLIEKPWNGFCAPKSFIDLYEYGVDRRGPCDSIQGTKDTRQWGWFLGPVYDAAGNQLVMEDKENLPACITSVVTSLDNATPNDGARLLKYEVEKNSSINKYCENDFVLFRYADVLYMKAEAALRGATNANISDILADSDFQKIRTRAGVEPYTTLDLDELLDERGREFAWEGVRRRDLIRYDRFSQGTWDFKPVVDKHFDWFPIPRKMLETSGGLWTQNEGYTN